MTKWAKKACNVTQFYNELEQASEDRYTFGVNAVYFQYDAVKKFRLDSKVNFPICYNFLMFITH